MLSTPPQVDGTVAEVICRFGPAPILNCQLFVAWTKTAPNFTTEAPDVVS